MHTMSMSVDRVHRKSLKVKKIIAKKTNYALQNAYV